MNNLIQLIRGDDTTLTITFTDETGTAIDLTGKTVYFTVKKDSDLSKSDDTSAIIKKTITAHSDPILGKTVVTLSNTDTNQAIGFYWWDLQILSSGKKASSLKGQLEIIQDVTKA